YITCFNLYEESLQIIRHKEDSSLLAKGYHNLGRIYEEIGIYDKALELFITSVTINEHLKNITSVSNTYNSIANCLIAIKEYDKALFYFNLSKELIDTSDVITI